MRHQRDHTSHEHTRAVPSRREALLTGAAIVAAPLLRASSPLQASRAADAEAKGHATQWLSYGADKASSKYSPLAQIGPDNFNRLRAAWTWRSPEENLTKSNPNLKTWVWESTPLMVDGVLYVS